MSAAVENGVDASKPRGVFSRAFAKRAQPFEEGEFCGENKLAQGLHYVRGAHGAFLVIGRFCYLIKHDNLVVDAVVKLKRGVVLISGFSKKKKKKIGRIAFFIGRKEYVIVALLLICYVFQFFFLFLFFFYFTFMFVAIIVFFIYILD